MAGGSPHQQGQATIQFLNHMFSETGGNALPYDDFSKRSIMQQLPQAVQDFTGLQPKAASFTHNDGRTVTLLQLEGTIPMAFQGVKYNIPVTLWLHEHFPHAGPLVYVTPTRDMIIKPQHACVDASGAVDIPYLGNWSFPRSTLIELLRTCCQVFSQEPPLYSNTRSPPSGQTRPPPRSPPRMPYSFSSSLVGSGSMTSPSSLPDIDSGDGRPATYFPGLGTAMASVFGSQALPATGPKTEDPDMVFRRTAIYNLTERLQKDIAHHSKEVQAEMNSLFITQSVLKQRAEQIDGGLRELQQEKEGLEQQLQVMLTNSNVVEEWLRHNNNTAPEVDIDTAFEPVDIWSKQLLESSASDYVLEDCMYSLTKAVAADDSESRKLSVDAYLKQTRTLARDQFFHRALAFKVRATQAQAQVAQMATRVPFSSR